MQSMEKEMGMNEIIPKDTFRNNEGKTRTGFWENHNCMGQGSGRGFSKESKQSQGSRKRTWSEYHLGHGDVERPKKERGAKMFTVLK